MEIKLKGSKGKRRLAANVAAINYFSPMSCATKKCKSTGSSNYWLSWIFGNDECYDVIGGCPTGLLCLPGGNYQLLYIEYTVLTGQKGCDVRLFDNIISLFEGG